MNEHRNNTQSAVLVLHELATDSFILTKRTTRMQHHPGEICFPGGRWEKYDSDLYATALRETEEELGISPSRITRIRPMKCEATLLGIIIHPWLAQIDTLEPYSLNTQEVESLIRISKTDIEYKGHYRDIYLSRGSMRFKSLEFTAHAEHIWGATARIMRQFVL